MGSAAARQLFATMVVEGKEVKFQLDTGATCNVIRKEDVPASVKIRQTTQRLTLFSQEDMEAAGKCTVRLVNPSNRKRYKGDFVVVHKAPSSILGAKTVQQMGLISVNHEVILAVATPMQSNTRVEPTRLSDDLDVLRAYDDVFSGEVAWSIRRSSEIGG